MYCTLEVNVVSRLVELQLQLTFILARPEISVIMLRKSSAVQLTFETCS
jgi:hypothetical protein